MVSCDTSTLNRAILIPREIGVSSGLKSYPKPSEFLLKNPVEERVLS